MDYLRMAPRQGRDLPNPLTRPSGDFSNFHYPSDDSDYSTGAPMNPTSYSAPNFRSLRPPAQDPPHTSPDYRRRASYEKNSNNPTPSSDTQVLLSREPSYLDGDYIHVGSTPLFALNPPPKGPQVGDDNTKMFQFKSFEEAPWKELLLHTAACGLAFPVVYWLAPLLGSGISLFWSRAIVGLISTGVGLTVGFILLEIGKRLLAAAVWATMVHESVLGNLGGITIDHASDLTENPTSIYAAMVLLYRRHWSYRGTRRINRVYDTRHWSTYLSFFLLLAGVAASASFILSRIITIGVQNVPQHKRYLELPIVGDLTPDDVARANITENAFADFIRTWSLTSYGEGARLPLPISFPYAASNSSNSVDTIYFSETWPEQLRAGATGFGTFDMNSTYSASTNSSSVTNGSLWPTDIDGTVGKTVMWPRWGIRIKCSVLPDPALHLVPLSPSNLTYVFVPQSLLQTLYSELSLPFPSTLTTPINMTKVLQGNDPLPAGLDPSTIVKAGAFYNNGVGFSFFSQVANQGDAGGGWQEMEVVLVRLNNTQTPQGTFPVYSPPTPDGSAIGYDAAVCIEVIEPYIVSAYNGTTGAPASLGIISEAGSVLDSSNTFASANAKIIGERFHNDDMVNDGLNSTGKFIAFAVAHDNSRNVMLKDNGRDFWYTVSPTAVAFTSGSGPNGYTSLSSINLERTLGTADASNLLPYLVGTQPILARAFPEETLAFAEVKAVPLAIFLGGVFLLGLCAAFFTPKLPFNLPRRDFGLVSWLAAFQGDELAKQLEGRLGKNMEIDDLRMKAGQAKLQYGLLGGP